MAVAFTTKRSIALLFQDRHAASALEFAIICPVFLMMLLGIFIVGTTGLIQLALDDAVRDAARQVQINAPAAANASSFLAAVCAEFGPVSVQCATSLTYNVQASTPAAGFAALTPAALSAAGAFNNSFFASGAPYAPSVNVLVQVAYPLPFSIPLVGSFATLTGTNSVVATASVRVEPFKQ